MQTLRDPLRAAREAVRSGKFQDAAVSLAELPPDVRGGPEWCLLSAMVSWRLGDFAASRQQALAARDGYRARGDTDGEMRATNVAAAGAFGLGALAEAEDGFHRALQLARELGDPLVAARCSNNLGNVALYLAQHDIALSFYRVARAGFERVGFTFGLAETSINSALAWRDLERYEDCLGAADEALDAAERARAPRLVAEALATRGAALAALGDTALGDLQVQRALLIARDEGDRLAEADVLRLLGVNAQARGDLEAALARLREALDVALTLGHPWTSAEIERDLGRVYRALGREREAATCFAAAEEAFRVLGSVPRAEAMRREGTRT